MNQELTTKLTDGRILGYAEYGDSSGFPLLYFHGGQESRYSSLFMDETARKLKIRIISPERPGIGLSTYQINRTFKDWGSDMIQLLDNLLIKECSIIGLSGGAPHALSCISSFPERIVNVTLVSGAAPYNFKQTLKKMWFPVKIIHWLASMKNDKSIRKFLINDLEELIDNPEKRLLQYQKYLPKPDKDLLVKNPQIGIDFMKGSLESYTQGIEGVLQEWKLYVTDWGLDLNNLQKHVYLWYGKKDVMAPEFRGLYYKKTLPDSTLHLLDNEAHFSLIRNHLEEILLESSNQIS